MGQNNSSLAHSAELQSMAQLNMLDLRAELTKWLNRYCYELAHGSDGRLRSESERSAVGRLVGIFLVDQNAATLPPNSLGILLVIKALGASRVFVPLCGDIISSLFATEPSLASYYNSQPGRQINFQELNDLLDNAMHFILQGDYRGPADRRIFEGLKRKCLQLVEVISAYLDCEGISVTQGHTMTFGMYNFMRALNSILANVTCQNLMRPDFFKAIIEETRGIGPGTMGISLLIPKVVVLNGPI